MTSRRDGMSEPGLISGDFKIWIQWTLGYNIIDWLLVLVKGIPMSQQEKYMIFMAKNVRANGQKNEEIHSIHKGLY
jgi:hypothetical protein